MNGPKENSETLTFLHVYVFNYISLCRGWEIEPVLFGDQIPIIYPYESHEGTLEFSKINKSTSFAYVELYNPFSRIGKPFNSLSRSINSFTCMKFVPSIYRVALRLQFVLSDWS